MNLSFCAVPLYFIQASPACSYTPCNGRIPALLTQNGSHRIHETPSLPQAAPRPVPLSFSAALHRPAALCRIPKAYSSSSLHFSLNVNLTQISVDVKIFSFSDTLFQRFQHSRRRPLPHLNCQLRLPDILQIMSIGITDNPAFF